MACRAKEGFLVVQQFQYPLSDIQACIPTEIVQMKNKINENIVFLFKTFNIKFACCVSNAPNISNNLKQVLCRSCSSLSWIKTQITQVLRMQCYGRASNSIEATESILITLQTFH